MVRAAIVWGYAIICKSDKELNSYDKSQIAGNLKVGYKYGEVRTKTKSIPWAVNTPIINTASNNERLAYINNYIIRDA